jgi:hypothetical protein
MDVFASLSGPDGDGDDKETELLAAIDRAVAAVDPLLKQTSLYPDSFRTSVSNGLAYVNSLAACLPGPVNIDAESCAGDPVLSSLFPHVGLVQQGLRESTAFLGYHRKFPSSNEVFALMGMRRDRRSFARSDSPAEGMADDGRQGPISFNSHTIEGPAPTEDMSRRLAAKSFFDCLVSKVRLRVWQRRRDLQSHTQEMELLRDLLASADRSKRPLLQQELDRVTQSVEALRNSLEAAPYLDDFEAVLLHPAEYLRMVPASFRANGQVNAREGAQSSSEEEAMFGQLIGFDRRDWTVTMVHCSGLRELPYHAAPNRAIRRLGYDPRG